MTQHWHEEGDSKWSVSSGRVYDQDERELRQGTARMCARMLGFRWRGLKVKSQKK